MLCWLQIKTSLIKTNLTFAEKFQHHSIPIKVLLLKLPFTSSLGQKIFTTQQARSQMQRKCEKPFWRMGEKLLPFATICSPIAACCMRPELMVCLVELSLRVWSRTQVGDLFKENLRQNLHFPVVKLFEEIPFYGRDWVRRRIANACVFLFMVRCYRDGRGRSLQ